MSSETIKRTAGNFHFDVKRLYLPYVINTQCPSCREQVQFDMGDQYISYPTVGKPENLCLYCEDCDEEWTVGVTIDVTVQLVPRGE